MEKPITIDKFAGMDDNGLFYVEGMSARKINGQSVLASSWYGSEVANDTDTGFSGLGVITGMANITSFTSSARAIGVSGQKIFDFQPLFKENQRGLIHTSTAVVNSYADIVCTKNENVIFTGAEYAGIGYLGQCASGSGTTSIIDAEGRNWTTLGVSTSAGSNKVYNLTKGEEFTITSITTTTDTNDTLNFTAGTNANAENDYFMVFVDSKFNLSATGPVYPQYKKQITEATWSRQIFEFENNYYVLNGNYIAQISNDESTVDNDIQQLPYKAQAICASVNNDRVLIGAENRGRGVLLLVNAQYLEDGTTSAWLSRIALDRQPSSITPYNDGWIVAMGTDFYYTNGYVLQRVTSYPDTERYNTAFNIYPNGMTVLDGKLFVGLTQFRTRVKNGIGVYDFQTGWSFVPHAYDGKQVTYGLVGVGSFLFSYQTSSLMSLVYSHDDGIVALSDAGTAIKKSLIVFQKFPQKVKINKILLNVSYNNNTFGNYDNTDIDITANIGQGKNVFWNTAVSTTGTTATSIVNSSYTSGCQVGQEIQAMNGNVAGEISYITAITNPGVSGETLTISPALSAVPDSGTQFSVKDLRKITTKTVTPTDMIASGGELNFHPEGFFSDKMYLEFVFDTTEPVTVNSITIY